MRNIRITIEYDGTDYQGWQLQAPGQPTVQGVLEQALREMTREPELRVRGAGRTDAGVHARGQVANFFTETRIPTKGFQKGLNAKLPRDVVILDCDEVEASFDARRSARGKIYRYTIWNAPYRTAVRDRYVWNIRDDLDLVRMREAAAMLVGEHDFRAFRAANCERESTVRIMRRIEVARGPAEPRVVTIEVEATAFLKNMVRIIAGTLVAVGLGTLTPARVAEILASKDRTLAGVTAPAQGLEMVRVIYDGTGLRLVDLPPPWLPDPPRDDD